MKDPRSVFTRIYEKNSWGASSVSGAGSTLRGASEVLNHLHSFLVAIEARSLLDIPCGDFNWMQHCNMTGITYIGADIVPALIELNHGKYPGVDFRVLNLIEDDLPVVDVILVRDCLVHLPTISAARALMNAAFRSQIVLTTQYFNYDVNADIPFGSWRGLNLMRPPFNLPRPFYVLPERGCKTLAAWDAADIREGLKVHFHA